MMSLYLIPMLLSREHGKVFKFPLKISKWIDNEQSGWAMSKVAKTEYDFDRAMSKVDGHSTFRSQSGWTVGKFKNLARVATYNT